MMIKIPQLLLVAVAPVIAMAALSSFAFPAYATRVYRAVTGLDGDASDDVVWSNVVYPVAAVGAWYDLTTMAVIWFTGCFLAVGSAAYHSTYDRWAQRLDVASMMVYLSSVLAAVCSAWTVWAWAVVPAAAVFYWRYTWQIDSYVHVPLWAVATITALVLQVGWAGLYAIIPVALGAIPQVARGADHWMHSLWHFGGAASVAIVLFLM